jgi:hypothetical protein
LRISHFLVLLLLAGSMKALADWSFTEIGESVNANVLHGLTFFYERPAEIPVELKESGGVASGDYDNDGYTDLYIITGDKYPNVLLRNDGASGFSDVTDAAGVGLDGQNSTGPVFADFDGDGWQDLVIGGIGGSGMRLFRNEADGSFEEVTASSGIQIQDVEQNDFSTAFGDPDGDGDLDMYVAHWGAETYVDHLWVNSGTGQFKAADAYADLKKTYSEADWGFTPVFSDIDSDGRQDLLIASDYGTSHVLINQGNLRFENRTTPEIDVRNGMGSAVADFDNDGDMDWFITSIWYGADYPDAASAGNRMYFNDGNGIFEDGTEQAGVKEGDWGWSACAADFNNDGWQDLFHVNGMDWQGQSAGFDKDPSRLFINKGDGSFEEKSIPLGINDRQQGRGVVCFDFDLDGDIDIFTANFLGETRLYRNDLEENPGYLQIALQGEINNPSAVGARILVTIGNSRQLREITVGSNYQSQNPLRQHFGLGGAGLIDELRVDWPHGGVTIMKDIKPNQSLTLDAADASPPPFTLQPGMTSTWYDPKHDGEGFVLELLADNRAVLYWFTYDRDGNQDWYIAVGETKGRRILFPELANLSGGEFGPDFDPEKVRKEIVGSAAFTWSDCDTGSMDWMIGEKMGRQELVRLTRVMGLECGENSMPDTGTEAGLSGSRYDPMHDGEGYPVEVLENGQALVYWFSFDPEGKPRWFFGLGEFRDGKMIFERMLTTHGGRFGNEFNPTEVSSSEWGKLELDVSCDGGIARYDSVEGGFGAGSLNVQRLTMLWQLDCKQTD